MTIDHLYFIRSAAGPIKIGRTGDVAARLKSLRCGNHTDLTLVGSLPGQGWQEPAWHKAFARDTIRGEWFKPSPDLERAIAMALSGEDWTEAVPPRDPSPLRLKVFGNHDPLRFRARIRRELAAHPC